MFSPFDIYLALDLCKICARNRGYSKNQPKLLEIKHFMFGKAKSDDRMNPDLPPIFRVSHEISGLLYLIDGLNSWFLEHISHK